MTYWYVTAKYRDSSWSWIWGTTLQVETRTLDEVVAAAAAKDFDVCYCDIYTSGVPKRVGEAIRAAVYMEVSKTFSVKNYFDIQLDVSARITTR